MTAIKKYVDGVIKKRLHELCKVNFYGEEKKKLFFSTKSETMWNPQACHGGLVY